MSFIANESQTNIVQISSSNLKERNQHGIGAFLQVLSPPNFLDLSLGLRYEHLKEVGFQEARITSSSTTDRGTVFTLSAGQISYVVSYKVNVEKDDNHFFISLKDIALLNSTGSKEILKLKAFDTIKIKKVY